MRTFLRTGCRADADLVLTVVLAVVAAACGATYVAVFPVQARPKVALAVAAVTGAGAVSALLIAALVRTVRRLYSGSRPRRATPWLLFRYAATGAVVGQLLWPLVLLVDLVRYGPM
jgi:hypothetical protein